MRFDILTIFPNILDSYINESILGRARKKGVLKIEFHNIRDYTEDKHKTVDDSPYGGGPGMILKIEPIYKCVSNILGKKVIEGKIKGEKNKLNGVKIILMSPKGRQFDQNVAQELSKLERIVLICGRYEGVDARVLNLIDEEISIGPYVLSGGELPAMVVVEAVSRLLPGVLGSPGSLEIESFSKIKGSSSSLSRHLVEYPQYTRPDVFEPVPGVCWRVPKVLLSGDHKKIKEWRIKNMS